ncbi:interleukin-18-like [Lycodopsis pacificus]
MACSYTPVTCVGTCGDAFYFQEVAAETDVDEDSFGIATRCLCCWVKSKDNKVLRLNDEQQFQVQNLTSKQLNEPGCKFEVQTYRESETAGRAGRPTMLYCNKDNGKNVVACCGDNGNIYSENMDALPEDIEETRHRALFYMTKLTATNTYQFESSWFKSEFLGFAPDGDNPSLNKLVLLKQAEDQVDESCQVVLCN